jgi:hypothetical protein
MNLKLKGVQRPYAAKALKIKSRQFITVCRAERITCLQQPTAERTNAQLFKEQLRYKKPILLYPIRWSI